MRMSPADCVLCPFYFCYAFIIDNQTFFVHQNPDMTNPVNNSPARTAYVFITELVNKSFWKQYGLLCVLNHSTLSQTELIRVFSISCDVGEHALPLIALKKQNKLVFGHFSMV